MLAADTVLFLVFSDGSLSGRHSLATESEWSTENRILAAQKQGAVGTVSLSKNHTLANPAPLSPPQRLDQAVGNPAGATLGSDATPMMLTVKLVSAPPTSASCSRT